MPSIVLFDGVCNLCNGFVRFVIARDPARRFQFAPLQSDAAGRVMREAGGAGAATDSIVLIEDGRLYVRSAAALRIAKGLGLPWSLAFGLTVVPRPLRDWVYDGVARSRYSWFGKRDVCMTPTPEAKSRFL
ncbi:MAG: thiol-disulfide oxidoreductase DCC family protein [Vicinamibacterales bacterium]